MVSVELMDTYRKLNPSGPHKCAGNVCVGDVVRWKRSKRVVTKVWGKRAGKVIEIRSGRSGPMVITATEKGFASTAIGPHQSVAAIKQGSTYHFSNVDDLKVEKRK